MTETQLARRKSIIVDSTLSAKRVRTIYSSIAHTLNSMRAPVKKREPVLQLLGPGNCVANCTQGNCPSVMLPIMEFAPVVSNKTHRKRAAFLKVAKALEGLVNDPDCAALLQELGVLRNKYCFKCRSVQKESQKKSTTKAGACRDKWLELKAKMDDDGCVLCGCTDGMTVEHTKPEEKMRNKKGKPVQLSSWTYWPTLGGPEAMQAEFDKPSVVPMCMNCQFMQPTHNAMKPKQDYESIDPRIVAGDSKSYHKRRFLAVRQEKQAYVDAKKLEIGKCTECEYRVVPRGEHFTPGMTGYPHAFQWAHRSELDKGKCVAKIVNYYSTLKVAKPLLDKEIARCRLLCMCCGRTETDARNSAPGPSEEGN